jgi:hypothetical protein
VRFAALRFGVKIEANMEAAGVVRLFTVNQGAEGQGKIGVVQQNRQAVLSFKDTAKADMGNEKSRPPAISASRSGRF